MKKNKQNIFLYSIIIITLLSLLILTCGGGGSSSGGGGELVLMGSGTIEEPFLIDSAAALQYVGRNAETLSAYYKQEVDLDLDGVSWTPIGATTSPFIGTYDGNNKRITNLQINTSASSQGLFGCIGLGGTVKNLGLEDVIIVGGDSVGGVVGYNSGTVENCYATGSVTGSAYNVGGVVGDNRGTVRNCYATSTVILTSSYNVGGVVGANDGTVENCYATGDVTGTEYVGGVVGRNIVYGIVRNCIAFNSTVTSLSKKGRVIGYDPVSNTLSNNYARSDMAGLSITPSVSGIEGADIDDSDYYNTTWWTDTAKWSFGETDVWNAPSGTTLPTFKDMPAETQAPTVP